MPQTWRFKQCAGLRACALHTLHLATRLHLISRGLEPRIFRLLAERSNQLSCATTCTASVAKRKRRQTRVRMITHCDATGLIAQLVRAFG